MGNFDVKNFDKISKLCVPVKLHDKTLILDSFSLMIKPKFIKFIIIVSLCQNFLLVTYRCCNFIPISNKIAHSFTDELTSCPVHIKVHTHEKLNTLEEGPSKLKTQPFSRVSYNIIFLDSVLAYTL